MLARPFSCELLGGYGSSQTHAASVIAGCGLGQAQGTCVGGGGDCEMKAGGGLPSTDMLKGGGGPSIPPSLTPPTGGDGCMEMLPVAYSSHLALSSKGHFGQVDVISARKAEAC